MRDMHIKEQVETVLKNALNVVTELAISIRPNESTTLFYKAIAEHAQRNLRKAYVAPAEKDNEIWVCISTLIDPTAITNLALKEEFAKQGLYLHLRASLPDQRVDIYLCNTQK